MEPPDPCKRRVLLNGYPRMSRTRPSRTTRSYSLDPEESDEDTLRNSFGKLSTDLIAFFLSITDSNRAIRFKDTIRILADVLDSGHVIFNDMRAFRATSAKKSDDNQKQFHKILFLAPLPLIASRAGKTAVT